ncbi:MAG: cache domain-containing protein [Candidatus Omnitrophica bacterium]|nr:cache domain-containing protein [Candidatus Omnitrophota bacterium]
MKIGDIKIKWQLMTATVLLVIIPVLILGVMSYSSARKGMVKNIKERLKSQCLDWGITAQAYHDLIKSNQQAAKEKAKNILKTQASRIKDLIEDHLASDVITFALKEPLLRACTYEKDMLLYGFTSDEFNSYISKFDQAMEDIEKLILEAESMGIKTSSVKTAFRRYKEETQKVKSRSWIESEGGMVDGAVRLAGDNLDSEFDKIAKEVSEKRLKNLLDSKVIGKTGYVEIMNYQGEDILHPDKDYRSANLEYREPSQNHDFISKIIQKAKNLKKDEVAYLSYEDNGKSSNNSRDKIIAVINIPKKKWVVGVNIYLEDLLEKNFEKEKKDELKELMLTQTIGKTGHFFIVQINDKGKGELILNGSNAKENIVNNEKNFPIKKVVKEALSLGQGAIGTQSYKQNDNQGRPIGRTLFYGYFKPWDWIIGASVDLNEFFKELNSIRDQIIVVCIISIILGLAVSYLFSNNITEAFRQLIAKMKSVASGNLEVEMNDIKTLGDKNEIGQLTGAFKKMADNLKEATFSKDYVDDIIENMNDALLVIDKQGKIKTFNNAACKLLKANESEILNHSIDDFFNREEGNIDSNIKDLFSKGKYLSAVEIALKNKEGDNIPVSINGAPFRSYQGDITHGVLVARDVSEHKKLVAELSQARKNLEDKVKRLEKSDKAMLLMVEDLNAVSKDLRKANNQLDKKIVEVERSNKELDDFTYVVSHDLKEPLRSIYSFSKFLSDKHRDYLDAKGKHYIDVIQRSVSRMQALIKDLLELSRITRRRKSYQNIDLNELLTQITEDLALRLEEASVELKVGNLPTVRCEKTRILQLFTNLITNAIKYNDKDKPVIEIGCDSSDKDRFQFFIKDNGRGIPEEYKEKIFGIFQRLDADDDRGTGVGLTICKKIVEAHGGSIWVNSQFEKGSTFYFTILKNPEERS